MTVDIVIPTFKPTEGFVQLITKLKEQTVKVNKIIIVNTEEKYFERLTDDIPILEDNSRLDIIHIRQSEFDHGKTRNMGAAESKADYLVFMTQDAIPADEKLLEQLLSPLMKDSSVAVSYARQVAGRDSSAIEKITRAFNYPEKGMIKEAKDLSQLGIKTYFCSNVCAAYNRNIFSELNGFINHTIFNEDMIFAAKAVNAGYKIAYTPQAGVIHSHNYTCRQQFHRNFDIGVSQTDHPEVFAGVSSQSEGKKLVKYTIHELRKYGMQRKIIPFCFMCGCKYLGYRFGKNYKRLPKRLVKKWTMNKMYWTEA